MATAGDRPQATNELADLVRPRPCQPLVAERASSPVGPSPALLPFGFGLLGAVRTRLTSSGTVFVCGEEAAAGRNLKRRPESCEASAVSCGGVVIAESRQEIQQFGDPPAFPSEEENQVNQELETEEQNASEPAMKDKFKGKKSKAAPKSGGQMYQWEIMHSLGLSDSEISKFQDPYNWLSFFPPITMDDLKAFGLGCDWRRSFITTDMNPFFDSFVRWQMRKLKSMGKIVKDLRYTIYSPLDGQPCADHDRATGEGVQPQDYTLIKMEVVPPFPPKMGVLEGKRVFLAAATLRPETMYGQTNAWVLPDGKYGAFEINGTDVFIVAHRAALNLAYQRFSKIPEKPTCLVELTGYDLIGLPLKSPLSFNEIIHALPMLTILMDKGTGIVTSVPSDAPDLLHGIA
ncbi:hypothetical protein NL676_023308 [Syzygium grande]|nr:hypothetical protein NL676_023308 [Syzygium grande]